MINYKLLSDTTVAKIDNDGKSRQSCSIENLEYIKWLAGGNIPEPADPAPDPPTNNEIYEQTMMNSKLLKAIVITLNEAGAFDLDNSILSNTNLKALIKSNIG